MHLPRQLLLALATLASVAIVFTAGCGCNAEECGDGTVDDGEECDDGNTSEGDGCSASCSTESPSCGDGELDSGEECDDGNTDDADGCSSACMLEPDSCGDGVLAVTEECDDGNSVDGDGCSSKCWIEPVCGNLVVELGEECEPPGTSTCSEECWHITPCPPAVAVACGELVVGDTTGGDATFDAFGCGGWQGPEAAYDLTLLVDRLVTLTLTPTADLDLLVVVDEGRGCTVDDCGELADYWSADNGAQPELVRFAGTAGSTYHVIVESWFEAGGAFTLQVDCEAPPLCGNGLLEPTEHCDDGNVLPWDGCDASCHFELNMCGGWVPISCGEVVVDDTFANGVAANFRYYCDYPYTYWTGPEIAYLFVPTVSEQVSATLSGLSSDLDLFVIGDTATGCDREQCLADGINFGTADEMATFSATAGAPVYLVVDSLSGVGGVFTLTLDCPSVVCGDGELAGSEECDYGDTMGGDGCDASCHCEPPVCGDAVPQCVEQCDDGNLNDADGCSSSCQLECGPPPAPPLDCTTSGLPGDASLGTAAQDTYSCLPPALTWSGPELFFELVPAVSETVRIDLTGLGADLDLFVLPADAASCNDCDGAMVSMNRMTVDESVEFLAEAGRTYHVVVESYGSTNPGGAFTLDVRCEADAVCGNGVVDAGEGCDDGNTMPGDGCDASCELELFCVGDAAPGPVNLTTTIPAPLSPFLPAVNRGTVSCNGPSAGCAPDGPDSVIEVLMPAGATDLSVTYSQLGGEQMYAVYSDAGTMCSELTCYDPGAVPMGNVVFTGITLGFPTTVYLVVDACAPGTVATTELTLEAL